MKATMTALGTLLLTLAACEGPVGPEGAPGSPGQDGEDGVDGKDGKDGKSAPPLAYTLSSACKPCHTAIHETWSKTGHAHAMVKVSGQKPADPPYTSYPAQPPADDSGKSYAWSDVTYLIGGYGWRAVLTDAKGYVITGSKAEYVTKTGQWQAYEASVAAGTNALTCAECHATGYIPDDAHEVGKKQDGLEGAAGSWIEEGVGCEGCHGKASPHVLAVGYAPIIVNRSSASCGRCHGHEPYDVIAARDGLIGPTQQWNEIGATKMRVVQCVDCHDPHRSAHHAGAQLNPDRGIIARCETCHYKKKGKDKVAKHATAAGGPTCTDCHMPRVVFSAVGNAAYSAGDLRAHLFRINTDPTAPQLSTDGKQVMPYLTLDLSCRTCHTDKTAKPDTLLQQNAAGYHD